MDDTLNNLTTFDPGFEPSAAELKEGQFLGENQNYRLEKNLGVGGMGEVWLAAEIRAGQEIRKVVVKTLRPDRRGNEGAQEKALKQFQLIQTLNHTNICPIYVIEKDPACGYLVVMGYANGGSYADWFENYREQNGGLPLKSVCHVLSPIADALDYAHLNGVIHRDVKPENMMFSLQPNGIWTAWLIDFGIAANLRTVSQATQGQYSSSGTASYMAPEQRSGEFQTAQTDEYSLAMVALEFLTGTTFLQAVQLLPPETQQVLNKALALNPTNRYVTCRAFIDALSATMMRPVPLPPAPPAPKVNPANNLEFLIATEKAAKEAELRQRLPNLEEVIQTEYQTGRYAEAITHLQELLQIRPDNENAKWLLNSATQKLEIQKKEKAERKAREEAKRKAREEKEQEGLWDKISEILENIIAGIFAIGCFLGFIAALAVGVELLKYWYKG